MSDEKIPYPQARDENDPVEDLFEDPFNGGARIAIPYRNEIGLIIQSIREVVALGQQFYEIIKQMRPVINYKTKPIQALPEVDSNDYVTTLNKMENWSLPQAKSYKVIYQNYLGMDVLEFHFKVLYSYGGTYRGAGQYLSGVQILPTYIDALPGFDLISEFSLQNLVNHGSLEEPIAGATLRLFYQVESLMDVEDRNILFHVTGNGKFTLL
jgi:hypothetical protein